VQHDQLAVREKMVRRPVRRIQELERELGQAHQTLQDIAFAIWVSSWREQKVEIQEATTREKRRTLIAGYVLSLP
jgi:hypothetical protein